MRRNSSGLRSAFPFLLHPWQKAVLRVVPLPAVGRQRGFTLIEILACVAIIAILAALLLPALSKMRLRADEAKFVSNLRQVSAAVLSLASDDGGTLPPHVDQNVGASTMWQLRASSYLGEDFTTLPNFDDPALVLRSTLRDPGDKTLTPLANPNRPTRNMAINGNANKLDSANSGATNRRLSSINYPSKLALLGPGGSAAFTTEWGAGSRLLPWEMRNQSLSHYSRYGEFMHFAFVDGHVEKLSWERVNAELELNAAGKSLLFDSEANNGGE